MIRKGQIQNFNKNSSYITNYFIQIIEYACNLKVYSFTASKDYWFER